MKFIKAKAISRNQRGIMATTEILVPVTSISCLIPVIGNNQKYRVIILPNFIESIENNLQGSITIECYFDLDEISILQ